MSLILLMSENGWLCLAALIAIFALLAGTRDKPERK